MPLIPAQEIENQLSMLNFHINVYVSGPRANIALLWFIDESVMKAKERDKDYITPTHPITLRLNTVQSIHILTDIVVIGGLVQLKRVSIK